MLVMFLKMAEQRRQAAFTVGYTTEGGGGERTMRIDGVYNAAEATSKAYDTLKNNPSIGTITAIRAYRN